MIQYRHNVASVLHATSVTSLCEAAQYSPEEQTRLESGFSRRQTSVGENKGGNANFMAFNRRHRVFFFFLFDF